MIPGLHKGVVSKDPLNLFEEITTQAWGPFLVECRGLSDLGPGQGMEPDYHPNRSRMEVKASSSGMVSTAPDWIS